jgi:hypothetical protein
MAKSRVFFVPICIDGTREDTCDVPEPFLHVQGTRLPGELAPNAYLAHAHIARIALLQGQFERVLQATAQEADSAMRLALSALVLHALGRAVEANAHLDEPIARHPHTHAYWIGMNFAYRRNLDAAFEWLERAVRQKEIWLAQITGEPLLRDLVKDPRYRECLREMHLPDRAASYPECSPH